MRDRNHNHSERDTMPQNETFYGYSNHTTMNVALAIQNDEGLYSTAKNYRLYGFAGASPFATFRETLRDCGGITGTSCGGFSFSDPRLNMAELDEVIRDIAGPDEDGTIHGLDL